MRIENMKVKYLGGYENFLTGDRSFFYGALDSLAYFLFVVIEGGGVNVPVSAFESRFHRFLTFFILAAPSLKR